jgi:predicted nucleotidyltransferase/predicted transcriptional regulator with HTH domain
MLAIIGRSEIRKKIILLFVYNQRKEFYLSEIARRVNTSAGTAQRELNRLLSLDFITFSKRGNLNFYKLNEAYSLLREIEAVVRKTIGIEVELGNGLSKVKGIRFAFLFGSYAKGDLRSDSDIDLFIVGTPDEDDVYRAVQKVEDSVGREINYHLADEKEFIEKSKTSSFYREILTKPLMLVGKEDELRELIR